VRHLQVPVSQREKWGTDPDCAHRAIAFYPIFLFYLLPPLGPVVLFRQVVGLGQTARVQRGPSEAARCASNGMALLPAFRI